MVRAPLGWNLFSVENLPAVRLFPQTAPAIPVIRVRELDDIISVTAVHAY